MKSIKATAITAMLGGALIAPAAAASIQHHVVPGDYANTPGDTNFTGPMTFGERTNQMLIHESLLTDLVGRQLTGLSFRLPANANSPWPAQDLTYSFYDVYLSGSVAPADRSFTYAENIVGDQTQVRSGGLTVPMSSYGFGGSPNDFGSEISFDSGWAYNGGHLLVEIRHSGNDVSSRSVDAINTNSPGYGTLFSALWTGDADATTGLQGRFSIMQFTSVPAPGALALLGLAGLCGTRRRR